MTDGDNSTQSESTVPGADQSFSDPGGTSIEGIDSSGFNNLLSMSMREPGTEDWHEFGYRVSDPSVGDVFYRHPPEEVDSMGVVMDLVNYVTGVSVGNDIEVRLHFAEGESEVGHGPFRTVDLTFTRVDSSNIAMAAALGDRLYVMFTSGTLYSYIITDNIDDIYKALISSESAGHYLHKNIKRKYEVERLWPPAVTGN